jgi:hypothetical protein
MFGALVGDDGRKGGENVWISRKGIDLTWREEQGGTSSEMEARRTPKERRKAGRTEAGREAARRNGRWPRESRKAGSRVGIESRKGRAAGVGGSFRQQTFRVTEWRLPWSRRTRPGSGLSDTILARRRRCVSDAAPRSTGGFGRTGYSGLCRVRTQNGSVRRPRPQDGRPRALADLAGQLRLDEFQIVGMGDPDAATRRRQHGER